MHLRKVSRSQGYCRAHIKTSLVLLFPIFDLLRVPCVIPGGQPGYNLHNYPAKSGILQSPSCVCLFVCLFVSRISHKLLVGFWWNLVSREVMIIGRPSSKLGVIRIEIRIWNPDNCFSWTTGRILDQDFNQIQDNSNLIIVIW